jgi:phage shock protein E
LLIGTLPASAGGEPVIIDVRTDEEYSQGHIEGALHMPHDRIGSLIGEQISDKDTPIVVYCRSGRRSQIAAETLADKGYTEVENGGGLEDLRRAMAEDGCVGEC